MGFSSNYFLSFRESREAKGNLTVLLFLGLAVSNRLIIGYKEFSP